MAGPSALGESLQASVLAKYGNGRIRPEERDSLRTALFQALGSDSTSDAVREEVDIFVQNGHVSSRNLSRLERFVQRRIHGEDADTLYSQRGSLSARSARQDTGSIRSSNHRPRNEQVMLSTQAPDYSSWSEIAKHSKRMEEREKMLKLDAQRSAQHKMRQELDQQVAEKEVRKRQMRSEEQHIFHQQQSEYDSWQASQDAQKEDHRRKALDVKRDREEQAALTQHQRDRERDKKLEQDRRDVRRAAREQELEKKQLHEKKISQKESMATLVQEWEEGKKHRDEEKRQRAEDEKKALRELDEMLKQQDARRKMTGPKVLQRPPAPPIPANRRGEELCNPERLMEQMKQASVRAEEAERQMIEERRLDGIKNRDFLFRQMAERDVQKRGFQDMKVTEKASLEDDTSSYLEAEKRRIAEQRTKNVRYRIELEKQITEKQTAPRENKDRMSLAEKAINRNLLQEVQELRGQVTV